MRWTRGARAFGLVECVIAAALAVVLVGMLVSLYSRCVRGLHEGTKRHGTVSSGLKQRREAERAARAADRSRLGEVYRAVLAEPPTTPQRSS